jgi:hydroxyethylthiazole kinase-like uncharacterized protein yjeF
MMKLATPDQMRLMDRAAAECYGVSGLALMENAGAAVARVAFRVASRASRAAQAGLHSRDRDEPARPVSVCILAGRGNNGGDGYAAARHLAGYGARISVYVVGDPSTIVGDARTNLDAMVKSGIGVLPLLDEGAWNAARADLAVSDVTVDAILGTGARGAPSPEAARAISLMNESPAPIVAVDAPSGVDALTGAVPGECVIAHTTVTLGLAKTGLLTYPGTSQVGRLVLDRIGMPPALIDSSEIRTRLTTPDDVRAALPGRRPDAHKGDFGRVLIIAGSLGMSGAPSLAAMGALRSGAGLVHLLVPAAIAGEVSARHAEVMTHPASEPCLPAILEIAAACQAVVVGPGMSCCERTSAIVDAVISKVRVPLVLDADAINVLAGRAQALREAGTPVVLIPHPGELGRLMGVGADEINRDRLGWARRAAMETGATVVLKGARTVIADKSGEAYVNPTGNPGMATAGMGDVLAGVTGSLCAAGLDSLAAGYCAAYLHGLAGDFAARERGVDGMVAGDVLAHVPEAFGAVRTKTAMLWRMMPIAYAHTPEGW